MKKLIATSQIILITDQFWARSLQVDNFKKLKVCRVINPSTNTNKPYPIVLTDHPEETGRGSFPKAIARTPSITCGPEIK